MDDVKAFLLAVGGFLLFLFIVGVMAQTITVVINTLWDRFLIACGYKVPLVNAPVLNLVTMRAAEEYLKAEKEKNQQQPATGDEILALATRYRAVIMRYVDLYQQK